MNYSLLWCLLLTHALTDFVFQGSGVIKMRTAPRFRKVLVGNLKHLLTYALLSSILLMFFWSGYLTAIVLAGLVVSHGLIDLGKSSWIYWRASMKHSLFLLFFDQFLHTVSIIIASCLLSRDLPSGFYLKTVAAEGFRSVIDFFPAMLTPAEKWFLAAFLMIMGMWGAGIFIRQFLQWINYRSICQSAQPISETESESQNGAGAGHPDGGFIIGLLERLFIILAIILGREEVIGFVLATKSVARFKKFDEDRFMEYFIIGSFLSFIIAIGIGSIIKGLKLAIP